MKSLVTFGMSALMLLSGRSSVAAMEPAKAHYLLAMQIHDGEHLVGSPTLKVSADELAKIDIGQDKGDRYTLAMLISPQTGQTVSVKSDVKVTSGKQHYATSPKLTVTLNEQAGIAFGMADKPIRIDFKITPTT